MKIALDWFIPVNNTTEFLKIIASCPSDMGSWYMAKDEIIESQDRITKYQYWKNIFGGKHAGKLTMDEILVLSPD